MSLALVHLVREANGEEPLRRFIASYRAHPAGAEHELVLVLKGFSGHEAIARALDVAEPPRWLVVPDTGLDLGAYFTAARALDHERLCFVNSHSVIQADGWLGRLADPVAAGAAGLVGASGSWASQLSHLRYNLGLGGPYAGLLGDKRAFNAVLSPPGPASGPAPALWERVVDIARRCATGEPFPARHVRTNAFCLARETLERVRPGRQYDKLDAYRLENGRRSLTHQVEGLGLRAVLTGRDGELYAPEDWPRSRTYWQGDQENLLVADNQTRLYAEAGPDARAALARFAWGRAAAG